MSTQKPAFHLPIRPYGPIDALNRRAAEVGSPGYAQATHYANYNGHAVSLSWNDFRGYYIAEYWYGGRIVIARGSFASCLNAALAEYNKGAMGCSVSVSPREDDSEAIALCEATPELVSGPHPRENDWYTWRHSCAAESVRDYANPNAIRMHFDWDLMQAAADQSAYEEALASKYGSKWAF